MATDAMETKKSLNDLAGALRRLHKALIDAEVENFGPVSGPYRLLDLVAYHPHFAWLHRLSELMVELDELRDDVGSADAGDAAVLRATLEELVGPSKPRDAKFRERYLAMLQQAPAVAMAHAELRQVLAGFPEPPSGDRDT